MKSDRLRGQDYREYFHERRPTRSGERVIRWWHRRMLRFFLSRFPQLRHAAILEIGVGHGYFSDACVAAGMAYHGVEMNEEQAQRMRASGKDVVAAAVPPVPTGPNVDVAWFSHVLEHAPTYLDALEMLRSTSARLCSRGYIVVISPDLRSQKWEFWGADWSHGFPTTLRRVQQLMTEAGFEVVLARHHTATATNPVVVSLITTLFRLIPYRLLDSALRPWNSRNLAYSFMTVFGWRQILVIGQAR